jgi:hypothetical protein
VNLYKGLGSATAKQTIQFYSWKLQALHLAEKRNVTVRSNIYIEREREQKSISGKADTRFTSTKKWLIKVLQLTVVIFTMNNMYTPINSWGKYHCINSSSCCAGVDKCDMGSLG